ncbi:FG-GAP-like repeat-containing protein [Roseiconus lacunae]|uniref:FG-GAP-like repeat-containing protein n=1 Tax=Roseiconus lacunae TaxID=2605694 RepID=A0ABT7PQS9_9BACT|nr:FG-GAP-like repeat-containing protein [Roseiconus lacunae]MDM4018815.1 FG-GAP-like repeat-containing protein [Roseiconus lacunae]
MITKTPSRKDAVFIVVVIAAVASILGITVYWFAPRSAENTGGIPADEATVVGFSVALAALDVEENERAVKILSQLVTDQPDEPALWANLAVAQLRLNDTVAAADSLNNALRISPESKELLRLKAEVLEASGDIALAIAALRELHQRWPDNIRVSFHLSTLLGQVNDQDADNERLQLLSEILKTHPNNLRVRCEYARLAATNGDVESLNQAIKTFQQMSDSWPPEMAEQLQQAINAIEEDDLRQTAVRLTFLENLSKPSRDYQRSLDELGILSIAAVGTPLRSFLALQWPDAQSAPSDLSMGFEFSEPLGKAARPDFVLAVEQPGERCSTLLSLTRDTLHIGESAALPFPGIVDESSNNSVCWADLNNDFRHDLILAGSQGCRVFLDTGTGDYESKELAPDSKNHPWKSAWVSDVDADGDLDVLLSDHESQLRCLQNDGNATFSVVKRIIDLSGVVELYEVDFDQDGDLDLVTLDRNGSLAIVMNLREGKFEIQKTITDETFAAISIGDHNTDGIFEIIAATRLGSVVAYQFIGSSWKARSLIENMHGEDKLEVDSIFFLANADLDNNGAVDVVCSVSGKTHIWLQSHSDSYQRLDQVLEMQVSSVADHNCDGLLDLIGRNSQSAVVAINQSRAGYGWHTIEPRANMAAGDKRFNTFGIGGNIEIRAGHLVQSRMIRSPRVHFGLGGHSQIDVARLIWPNGTSQAEFNLKQGSITTAEQRLKGSCPWVFTYDGKDFRFIKDFLWRSPLGLKINGQETAGITQTEDRIKIPREYLKSTDGHYDIRITAELWETHFFDHVALLKVEHPQETEIFVDECFAPKRPPHQEIFVGSASQPLVSPINQDGLPMGTVLSKIDGRYASDFDLGPCQGVAQDHWIEFQFPASISSEKQILLVGHGWIYPTDSSLNVAIAQQNSVKPMGLVLERKNEKGQWEMVCDEIGFPAGKNKDVVIEMDGQQLTSSVRYRLRTNMEIYWDSLRWSFRLPDEKITISRLELEDAKLLYRGFSKLEPMDRRRPDTPIYQVDQREQRWLDLQGYHTRHGDVRPLLDQIDDRYVIMNAGDELRFQFADPTGHASHDDAQTVHDFILIGDGWVKDGDFNTAFSKTVRPLPSHHAPGNPAELSPLDQDPVFQRHASDWQTFHTRYVSPASFHNKLRRLGDLDANIPQE